MQNRCGKCLIEVSQTMELKGKSFKLASPQFDAPRMDIFSLEGPGTIHDRLTSVEAQRPEEPD